MEAIADGKRRLIDAALRLAAAKRSFAALSLREIAREAGLNPNTFYRHFSDMEDLAITAMAEVGAELRPMLRAIRWAAARNNPGEVASRACDALFRYAQHHRDAFLVGACGITGPQPALRVAIRAVLDDIAAEMAEDIERLGLCPKLSRPVVDDVCACIVSYLFQQCIDYIEADAAGRRKLMARSVQFCCWLLQGAAGPNAQGAGGAGRERKASVAA
ncbi:TetR family transcriptional regulator [Cupriavidus sp. TMH.W2]|uniref:TetR family transcriptional regulator n=1 Tax=Cupriavidus sp. TMH.W2 TaxID=3434465 RepID=UPI003D771B35